MQTIIYVLIFIFVVGLIGIIFMPDKDKSSSIISVFTD
jgi:hypothetical protein